MKRPLRIAAAALLAAAMIFAIGTARAADTLTIGFTVSQTGALNVDSLAQLRGFEMWRDDVNAAGGIKAGGKRYQVQFVTYDDQSQGSRVQQFYTRLIVQDKAQFLFSPYSSGLADPDVLMIDELSLGLAPVVVQQLLGTLKRLKDSGLTILLVEQNVHLALALSDYAYVIAEGKLFAEGPAREVAARPDIRKAYLGL